MRSIFAKTALALLMFCLSCTGIFAQDIDARKAEKDRLTKEIALIDKQLKENSSKSRNALTELSLLQKKISNRKALIAQSDAEIRRYGDKIYLANKQIARLQARHDTLETYYSRLIRGAYKNRDAKIWYMYILASDDLGQAFRRYGYFKNLSLEMRSQAEKLREAKEELEAEKNKLAVLKREAEGVKAERKKEYETLVKEEARSKAVVGSLQKEKKKYQSQLAAKKKRVDALNREIERLIAEAMKASKPSSGKKEAVDYKLAGEFAANKGKLPWPVEGPVVDKFGQHFHPVYKSLTLPKNNGVDIATAKNAPVKCVFDGVVMQVIVMPSFNQCVLVQHGNYFSFYCKLKSVNVKAGAKVTTGQVIGTVDTIGGETQLHFQIWKGDKPQNPELWLR
ncbi:MAG: murein hydrolase activator EnvC family protein [Candidatus Cryptobacteroides sp.]